MIIFINGSINAGKSTIAKILGDKLPKSKIFEPDYIDDMMVDTPLEQKLPIIYAQIPKIIRKLVNNDYNVIIPYVFNELRYKEVTEKLKDIKAPVHFISLAPKLEVVLKNRGERVLTGWEKDRIVHHYSIGVPTLGIIIDNSNEKPEETAERIMAIIKYP